MALLYGQTATGAYVRVQVTEDGQIVSVTDSAGGTVTWNDITGKPLVFPTDWSLVANPPAVFPSDWGIIGSKPATFPSDWNTTANKPTIDQLLPAQAGNAGEYLRTDGTVSSWQPAPSGPGGTSVHGDLSGLDADDHLQYARVDGFRPFTGNLAVSNAGLSLSGGGGVSFTSPELFSFIAKFGISPSQLSEFQTVFAMGATASSHVTGRLIGLFDARTSTHQATFGVFSPDESDICGLSWDGSTDVCYLKTAVAAVGVKIGTSEIFSCSSTRVTSSRPIRLNAVPTYADVAAALAAGLVSGDLFKTSAGELRIV